MHVISWNTGQGKETQSLTAQYLPTALLSIDSCAICSNVAFKYVLQEIEVSCDRQSGWPNCLHSPCRA